MKLGVSYNLFDGVELLEYSIKQIRNHVDFICVVYQTESYYGKPLNEDIEKTLSHLKSLGIGIDYYEKYNIYVPANHNNAARVYEKEKRNLGRNICYENGCDYFLDMDCDELYKSDEFEFTKKYIEENDIDYSFCKYINYIKYPTYQEYNENNDYGNVVYICKLNSKENVGHENNFYHNNLPVPVDPTRSYDTKVSNKKVHFFGLSQIAMHHMNAVRKNLLQKYENTSRGNLERSMIGKLVESIKEISPENLSYDASAFNTRYDKYGRRQLRIVENYFNLPLWEG